MVVIASLTFVIQSYGIQTYCNNPRRVYEGVEGAGNSSIYKRRNDDGFPMENVFSLLEKVSTPFYLCLTYSEVPATSPSFAALR